MEINLSNLKIDRAVTVSFYIMSVLLPLPFGLLIYDSSLFIKLDILKLLLMSISVTGCSIIFNFILITITVSFIKGASLVINKHKNDHKDKGAVPENNESIEIEKGKDKTGEMSLYLTFLLNNLTAFIIILNLLRLKYYLHLNINTFINASVDTYLLICLLWYLTFLAIFIVLIGGLFYIARQKATENKLAFYLMRRFLEQKQEEATDSRNL